MPPVFGHGRLRLYLLKLLGEAPRHGYEVIRLLEERFQGLYAPSAGTVYPRLAKLEAEGLVTHTEEGGRKVYSLTPEGERELADRVAELTDLEREIHDSLATLATEIREDVRGSVRDLRQEIRQEIRQARSQARASARDERRRGNGERAGSRRGARQAREEAREEAREAREQFEQAAQRIHERVQPHTESGDWRRAVREGLAGLSHEFGGLGGFADRPSAPWSVWQEHVPDRDEDDEHGDRAAKEDDVADPARELERLLDRLRDDVRDAARDHGVTQAQLRETRRVLSTAAAHLVTLLRTPED